MLKRNEILVAEDEEEIRAAVISVASEVFPGLSFHEAALGSAALRILHETGDSIFLVVSDEIMCGDVSAGENITSTAREKGVAHVALYSTGADAVRQSLEPNGIRCITKTNHGEPHHELRTWLKSIIERPQR